ncbi:copper resistance protein B [Nitratiruptor sp. YY08-26]|uniref:copper resistance protein B n=1 Tax=unclassified Nitratiruptor TaxID=2624044 RepID=UPI001914E576|nr:MULTISPECIES: copper resistance protein B [unclassified Nitratiruptor]BCD61312.1 copper resistance protein B [Nitratiruptor sp. YY08-13]BCD65245.1 copper resistance protein B [Nitratiruptor sp. YY08-26]
MKNLFLQLLLFATLISSALAGGGGDILRATFTADSLEYQANDERAIYWDTYGYIGYDINKLYFYSEGEKPHGESANSENQLLYSRAIAPFWDLQIGVGLDRANEKYKSWAIVALAGLAPYFFETRAALLVGENGNMGLRIDLEYEALLTQKLILTPKVSTEAYIKDEPRMGYGAGLSNLTIGARLRYEIKREFAPYIGIEWSKNFGNTRKYSPLDEAYFVGGVRFWF